jgi:hypothetical protein
MPEDEESSILFDCFVNWAETMFTFDTYKKRKSAQEEKDLEHK